MSDTETFVEIYDLDAIILEIEAYKKMLTANGHTKDKEQEMSRMIIEKRLNDWRKFWSDI